MHSAEGDVGGLKTSSQWTNPEAVGGWDLLMSNLMIPEAISSAGLCDSVGRQLRIGIFIEQRPVALRQSAFS